jgi:membrane protease YdiL (CAAX protease family)
LELNTGVSASLAPQEIIARFLALLALSVCGLYAARASGLRGSLFITSEDRGAGFRDFMIYGVLPGAVLGIVNYLLFFGSRYSPLVQAEVRNISSVYDASLVSLNAAVGEEVLFRLFTVSALLYFLLQVYAKIFHVWPLLGRVLPGVFALVLSSLLFAIAHNVAGFTAGFSGGIVLGLLFLKSGVEASMAAHFVANLLFYSASYLS